MVASAKKSSNVTYK